MALGLRAVGIVVLAIELLAASCWWGVGRKWLIPSYGRQGDQSSSFRIEGRCERAIGFAGCSGKLMGGGGVPVALQSFEICGGALTASDFQRECLCRGLGCRFWQLGPANFGTPKHPR